MEAHTVAEVDAAAIVLVEGMSDKFALEALAERRGRDLAKEGVSIVSMGGATNIRTYLDEFARRRGTARLAGLCDVGEEGYFQRALASAGSGSSLTRVEMEERGFFVCVTDLEDELIRALRPDGVEGVLDARGDLRRFRVFQRQPAQEGRPIDAQLHRFMGTKSQRKHLYARWLVEALDLDHVPRPLDRVLTSSRA